MKTEITIKIDTDRLETYTDSHLAALWHTAQANPAPLEDDTAADVVETIAREIIRRWLKSTPPELWHHQGRHPYWHILQKNGKWLPVNGDENKREWVPNKPEAKNGVS